MKKLKLKNVKVLIKSLTDNRQVLQIKIYIRMTMKPKLLTIIPLFTIVPFVYSVF